jgi:hypothetical protein
MKANKQVTDARAAGMSTASALNMLKYGELSPRLEHSDVFPDGLTLKWIDDAGNIAEQWLCQNAQALYKQLHEIFGTAFAVNFLNVYRWQVTGVRRESVSYCISIQSDVDLDRWNDDGGFAW